MNIWDKIAEMTELADKYIEAQMVGKSGDSWIEFEKIADIHISLVEIYESHGLSGAFQAIAYPLDKNGTAITNSSYIQLF